MRKILLGWAALTLLMISGMVKAVTPAVVISSNTYGSPNMTTVFTDNFSATVAAVYWGPVYQVTPTNYPNSLTSSGGASPWTSVYNVSSFANGSGIYQAALAMSSTAKIFAETTYVLPSSTPTFTETPTQTPNWTHTVTPTITPTITPTFVSGGHLVSESPLTETFVPAVPSTYNFPLTYYPSGPISMSVLDQTTGHWVFIDSIPRTSQDQLLSVASASPGLLAYTIIGPKTYQMGIGSRNQVFVTGRTYLIYVSYSTFAP